MSVTRGRSSVSVLMPKPTLQITVATPSAVLRTLLAIAPSFVYNIDGSRHQIRGTKWENSMIGTRIMGKAFDNFDFTLNYLFKRADPAALVEWGAAFDINQVGPGGARNRRSSS